MSIKDRGAVLPAGHMADAAFWYDDISGTFISSTYYMSQLPAWVDTFNKQGLPAKYLAQPWNTLYPIEQYVASGPDDTPYEIRIGGKPKPVFPYKFEVNEKTGYGALAVTPFANDFLTEFAKTAISAEKLGQGEQCDFLAISYSTPDAIGHATGPNSVEVEDIYLRLDKNVEDLLKSLDEKVGKGNYVVFITADHAVADVAQYLKDNKIPAGYFNDALVESSLKEFLKKYFPEKDVIENISNDQIFFNNDLFQNNPRNAGVDFLIASELIAKFLIGTDGIANVYTESVLRQGRYDEGGMKGMVIRGHHPKRSGDLTFVLEPGWYAAGRPQGTTHGSPYSYDTHVPVLFYGSGIKKGSSVHYHSITDIAPTLSMLLKIKFPSGCTGQPVAELFE
jgi:predicted AlkP superfamily pyrophosphatase or phosphodiesterase